MYVNVFTILALLIFVHTLHTSGALLGLGCSQLAELLLHGGHVHDQLLHHLGQTVGVSGGRGVLGGRHDGNGRDQNRCRSIAAQVAERTMDKQQETRCISRIRAAKARQQLANTSNTQALQIDC